MSTAPQVFSDCLRLDSMGEHLNRAGNDLHNHSDGNTKYANTENTKKMKNIPISGIQKYYSNVMFAAKRVNRICAITLKKDANLWSWHLLLKVWCHTHGGGIYTKRVRDWAISFSVSFGPCEGWPHTILIHFIAF